MDRGMVGAVSCALMLVMNKRRPGWDGVIGKHVDGPCFRMSKFTSGLKRMIWGGGSEVP